MLLSAIKSLIAALSNPTNAFFPPPNAELSEEKTKDAALEKGAVKEGVTWEENVLANAKIAALPAGEKKHLEELVRWVRENPQGAPPSGKPWRAPTGVQVQAIPLIIGGHDLVAHARGGYGKTGAYGVSALHVCARERANKTPAVIVLADTRTLCQGTMQAIKYMVPAAAAGGGGGGGGSVDWGSIKVEMCCKGTDWEAQGRAAAAKLRSDMFTACRQASMLVGTPGMLRSFFEKNVDCAGNVRLAIFDEADAYLLDGSKTGDCSTVLKMLCDASAAAKRPSPQVCLFSATFTVLGWPRPPKEEANPEQPVLNPALKDYRSTGGGWLKCDPAKGNFARDGFHVQMHNHDAAQNVDQWDKAGGGAKILNITELGRMVDPKTMFVEFVIPDEAYQGFEGGVEACIRKSSAFVVHSVSKDMGVNARCLVFGGATPADAHKLANELKAPELFGKDGGAEMIGVVAKEDESKKPVSQGAQTMALQALTTGAKTVIVGTTTLQRGTDIKGLNMVVSLDIPMRHIAGAGGASVEAVDPDSFQHRTARIGRMGQQEEGKGSTFVQIITGATAAERAAKKGHFGQLCENFGIRPVVVYMCSGLVPQSVKDEHAALCAASAAAEAAAAAAPGDADKARLAAEAAEAAKGTILVLGPNDAEEVEPPYELLSTRVRIISGVLGAPSSAPPPPPPPLLSTHTYTRPPTSLADRRALGSASGQHQHPAAQLQAKRGRCLLQARAPRAAQGARAHFCSCSARPWPRRPWPRRP